MDKRKAGGARRCPRCGGRRVTPILWGIPVFSKRLERALRSGRAGQGGGSMGGDGPDHRCNGCGHEWRE